MNDEGLNFASICVGFFFVAYLWKRGLAFMATVHWPSTLAVVVVFVGLACICMAAHRTGRAR